MKRPKPDYIKKRPTNPHAYKLKDKLKPGLRSKLEIRTAQHRKPVEEVAHHVGSSAPKRDTRIHLLHSTVSVSPPPEQPPSQYPFVGARNSPTPPPENITALHRTVVTPVRSVEPH
ncbi:hypothetical protein Rs2_06015 [Raphanus sativus]|nr:hypothetical protein Rs2_06015 [Raphanus sativus]